MCEEEKITLKPYAYRILKDEFKAAGKYYLETLDEERTAETFGLELKKVKLIVEFMERYSGGRHHGRTKTLRDYLE